MNHLICYLSNWFGYFKRDYSTRFYIHTNITHFMNTHGKYSHIFLLTTMITIVVMLGLASSISSTLFAQSPLHSGHAATNDTISKYTDQEDRIIKSLSSEDIKSLQTGTGDAFGGMAKLAELNGYPGPRHVFWQINLNLLMNRKRILQQFTMI